VCVCVCVCLLVWECCGFVAVAAVMLMHAGTCGLHRVPCGAAEALLTMLPQAELCIITGWEHTVRTGGTAWVLDSASELSNRCWVCGSCKHRGLPG
jgi:hypothetical protein